jgi:hypothetical protein
MDKTKIILDLTKIKLEQMKKERDADCHKNDLTFTPRSFTSNYRYVRNVGNIYEYLNGRDTSSWRKYKENTDYEIKVRTLENNIEKESTMNRKWNL